MKEKEKSEAAVIDQLSRSASPIDMSGGDRIPVPSASMENHIAICVRNYWGGHGYYVDVAVRDVFIPSRNANQRISYKAARSNMINGLPSGYKERDLGICAKPAQEGKKEQ